MPAAQQRLYCLAHRLRVSGHLEATPDKSGESFAIASPSRVAFAGTWGRIWLLLHGPAAQMAPG